jgi:hypothetical protein
MRWQQQCGCRRRCVKQCMGRLWQFRCNRFVLRTYRHHPVARFPWRRGGWQSEHGQRRGNLGGSSLVDLPHQWAPLEMWSNLAIHHHCSAPMGVAGERAQGFWSGARGGGEKVSIVMVMDRVARLTTIFWCVMFNALFLHEKVCSVKNNGGGGMILMCF